MEIKSKRYIVSLLVTVFGLLALISSTSYAILRGSTSSSNIHIVRAGSVELEVNEKYNSMETGFYIMKDTDGLQQETVYNFTITNIGTVPAKYDLKLLNTAPSGQTALSDSYIRIGLEVNGQEMGPMGLSNVNNVIDSNTINNEEVIRYKMRVWLDKNHTSDIQSNSTKKAYLSLKVEAKQSAYTPKTHHYVYRNEIDKAYTGNPLDAGTYTGYCLVNGSTNSCNTGQGFLTQEACNNQSFNIYGNGTCQAGSWTTSQINYTEDATTLDSSIYIRHNIGEQTEVLETYICYILNNNEYCLQGGDLTLVNHNTGLLLSPSFETNKEILDDSFGASNCTGNDDRYQCSLNGMSVAVYYDGSVNIDSASGSCEILYKGSGSQYSFSKCDGNEA